MKPFVVEPLPVVRVWGGLRLAQMGRLLPGTDPIGESWEIHGAQAVRGHNCTLDELCQTHGQELLGEWCRDPEGGFPLLTKWLDCNDWLSVQVHPDDAVARRLEGPGHRGKAEAWWFAEVEPQGEVIHGWDGARPAREEISVWEGADWLQKIRRLQPEAGSWSYTPPGTVHALGPGLLVFEIQQSSDLTYRLYDWGRVGLDGQPRPLHLAQGVEAICDSLPEPALVAPTDILGEVEILCPHFVVESVEGGREWSPGGRSVELITAIRGELKLEYEGESWSLSQGDSLVLPARLGRVQLHSGGGWLRVRLAPT